MLQKFGGHLGGILIIIYIIGLPVSFGVSLKITNHSPISIFAPPIWPVLGLGYLGYRLAP